ncbi:MAG: type I pullulanase [Clostridiaceae bacterium]|nr:type I pullulanase [Clostridiaceae bacterium]
MSYVLSKEDFGEINVSTARIYNTDNFNENFYYDGDDLGAVYKKDETRFRLWAPTAEKVILKLYDKGDGGTPTSTVDMVRTEKGTWYTEVKGDLNGVYYTYEITVNGQTNEAVDPYAKAVGVNGNRGMVVDLAATNPKGWEKVGYIKLDSPTDAVIYEMHIRDTSIDPSSGIKNKGKYLGFTEIKTKSPESGVLTGLSHVKELGATHIHLLPSFDFNSVDEKNPDTPQFNWGYDPKNYNAPEGSYSMDPFNGDVRIREFKEMVKAIKSQGIGVVMDVVYNHTALSADSDFNKIVPGYYYRITSSGAFSNGSACGNELASERLMVRKFIVDSVVYWAKEYKIDGFRFDLMGLHDIDTMNGIARELKKVNPSILLYGEGWTAGASTLPQNKQAIKSNISKVPDIAVFNDNIRDGIKGHVFDSEAPGFISGKYDLKESVKFGIVGAVSHPGINYSQVNYDRMPFAVSPCQCVNYVASHDNLTFFDKLIASTKGKSEEELKTMTKLGSAIVITSQGIPFMLSGTDFMRTKKGDENSYKSPDDINAIDWELKSKYMDVFEYHKGLIALRKAHPAFRIKTAEEVASKLKFIDTPDHLIAYTIENYANKDNWKTILVAFNASGNDEKVSLPLKTKWNIVVDGNKAGVETLATLQGDLIIVPAMSAIVAYDAETAKDTSGKTGALLVAIGAGVAAIAGILGAHYLKKRKKTKK